MHIYSIDTGYFKLDGGAMFGVVPKTIWNRLNPSDSNNLCSWAMRCLLIEDGDKLILIDNGIGNKQSDKFFGYYDLHGEGELKKSLSEVGFHPDDITDVILTHLHFDHCGGSIEWNSDRTKYQTTFKNATYWSQSKHWNHALNSNPREKASFLTENIIPIQESGQLKFIDENPLIIPQLDYIIVSGHTESMVLPKIKLKNQNFIFCADLIPSAAHLPVNYIMAYDIEPLKSMQEKAKFLEKAFESQSVLIFEHDPFIECCTLTKNDRNQLVLNEKFEIKQLV